MESSKRGEDYISEDVSIGQAVILVYLFACRMWKVVSITGRQFASLAIKKCGVAL
jgi:hypothetical protein